MYVGPYAICVLNWNWLLTQNHFLIEHWNQHTHCCSARVVGLEEYSLVLVSRYSTVRSGTLTWHEWGLWPGAPGTSFGHIQHQDPPKETPEIKGPSDRIQINRESLEGLIRYREAPWNHSHLVLMYDVCVFNFLPTLSFIYMYKTSYPTLRCVCGGRTERPQIRPKISWARFVEKRQWFWS